jgi:ABC-2 type transport system ATP-binding protein
MTEARSADRSSEAAIVTESLVKQFGEARAVDGLSLTVPRGRLFGFLGPNGAGKTTTLKMLTGLLRPSSGRAIVAGYDVQAEPLAVKRRIGVVPESLGLYERLSATEYLELVGRLHALDAATISRRSARLLELLDLGDRASQLTVDYSAGMKKKTALAAALLPNPEIIFLDEPFEGIDAVSARVIKDMLRSLVDRRGVTVFFSTHIMELVEKLCDEVAIIHHGRLVAQGSMSELRAVADGRASAQLPTESTTGAEIEAGREAPASAPRSLEEIFLTLVDAAPRDVTGLDWLDGE